MGEWFENVLYSTLVCCVETSPKEEKVRCDPGWGRVKR